VTPGRELPRPVHGDSGASLRADCDNCFGLCCVVPSFSVSADFAIDKPAGHACPNLQTDFRCRIHATLRGSGFPGCAAYDCFGAGQKVSRVTFAGEDWRGVPATAAAMFAAFPIVRQLHELLWYVAEALTFAPAQSLHADLEIAFDETERLSNASPQALAQLDLPAQRHKVSALLVRASELVRAEVGQRGKDHGGADLIGVRLTGADLCGANLRAAQLIGADLRDADLRFADLLGADCRGADLSGADLCDALFLTQAQLEAAKGDADTKLPGARTRPSHWGRGATRRVLPMAE
jgi:uncharacterized protein YjbI with pentapeptide repeats